MKCVKCAEEIQAGWRACPNCGQKISSGQTCNACGRDIQGVGPFCPFCGNGKNADQQEEDLASRPTDRMEVDDGESAPPRLEELRRDIQFDVAECERASRTGQGSKNYIEKAAQARISDWQRGAELAWPEAQWLVGRCTDLGLGVAKDEVEAVRWYRKAAEQGYALGQNSLGQCYKDGTGVAKDDIEAMRWFRKAAEQGHAKGQNNLGWCYRDGTVARDTAEAVRWYRKAAEQGDAEGQNNLGICFYFFGEAEDKVKAAHWFRKAAEQGHAGGQYFLGRCYRQGDGVAKDDVEAMRWFRKAAEQGDEDSTKALAELWDTKEEPKEQSQGGCFISTAVAQALNWGDDATELNRLRAFRDTWMQTTPELRAEVAEYYHIAPGIVRQIDMSGEAEATYRSLCDDFILPALAALDRNEPVEAHRLYRAMVETLAARFPAEKRHGTIMNDRKRGSR